MPDKNSDRVLDLILNQLEKLNENQERLSEEIQKTNIELTKISGLKHAVGDLNSWKQEITKVVNADDLSEIKKFYNKHQDVDAIMDDLYVITKELRIETDDYKKFKTKAMTIIAVISFLFTAAITLIGLFK